MVIELQNAAATRSLGIQLGQVLPAGTVLLLQGDLGSGKTSLVQGIGEGLGIRDAIESPTFTLINEYLTGRIPLYHFDLYRLEPEQTATLYPEIYWEGIEVEPGICAIEWAERLAFKPDSYLEIVLTYQDEGRKVEIQAIKDAVIPELRIRT
ncbi:MULTISPECIES: tRNA (adenosine(37)-N6)-threonylcarbamoyltransferase complex ATPase subunit type 1 TsaE [Leptolyngbya]|uniref:tRNA (adenosine(37)-N6)-threonylcarbamoyltransferase complex ATPase subunit type 1 TsaE n=1 Tax=Leptolyngbya TaxID=47251 RepID=UPI00168847B8|nr:tRNA (adenosine(37)-N6)-threonylcarbamoyltransferase complex ATPase subunit type 1 TsaE [Leptolyngbya sp. FACHB-1624]MBD1858456.1 tRNA (adenosine(37)-N6)-threonylcarbamoyltransferase complex ATPase subunit type 1 TsaE [Leptolyngbya sp. FACHB-1624]